MAAASVAALIGLATTTPPPATAAPRQTAPATTSTAVLRLLDQPVAVAPNGEFTVLAEVVGATDADDFAVDIYDRTPTGEPIGPEPDRDPDATFGPVALTEPDAAGRQLIGFTIRTFAPGQDNPDPQWGHRIEEPGVYPVRIRVRGPDGEVGTLMTTLIRLPDADQVVPVTASALLVEVHRAPPTDPAARAAGDDIDPQLLTDLDPVLAELATHPTLPATFAVTPDTVARLVADGDAAETLGRLRTALDEPGRGILASPYVDLDPTAMVAAGLRRELTRQRNLGGRTLTELLERPDTVTWRMRTALDGAALTALAGRSVTGLIVPEGTLQARGGELAPAVIETAEGPVRVSTATTALTVGHAAPDDPVLAAHLLLARLTQTSVDAAAADGAPPAVIVDLDPATASPQTLGIVLDALAFGTPFARAATVGEVLARPAPTSGALAGAAAAPLGAYPQDLVDARAGLRSYTSMVADQPERTAPFERTLAVSGARDLALDERRRDARSVSAALEVPFGSISTPARDKVTLGARSARFPLPIESTLDHPVRVVIEIESNDRLQFPKNRIETTLEEGRQIVQIRVRTRTTGDTPVRITVRSPDGAVILSESRYTIRSTAVSGVGVILTVGAAGFLALWWGRNWRRNRGRARHARRRGRPRGRHDDDV